MQEEPRDPVSPFAALIQDYMWNKRRPPITANRLATELHISRQTVTNWLSGKKPQPEMLTALSQHTGIPMRTLYEAAGYPVPDGEGDDDVVERIMRMSPEERQHVLDRIDTFLERARAAERDAAETRDPRPKTVAGVR